MRAVITRIAGGTALVLLCACTDRVLPTAPPAEPPAPPAMAQLACTVAVRDGTMSCEPIAPAAPSAAKGDRIIGGQDVYVRITTSGTSYDSGTGILQTSLTVQNLADREMGTDDGSTTSGVRVFVASGPNVTGGSGSVTVNNPDGLDVFLSANQPYFLYNQILTPYEISAGKTWQFKVDSGVTNFTFTLFVSAKMPDESAALLDKVWTGAVSSDWADAGNWKDGVVPDSTSTVAVPPDALLASHTGPVLSADVVVKHLRVGAGSTLGLNGHALRARGNVDAVGTISGGTQTLSGTDVV
ncbi:MAG TPA: hypothetical protein VF771_12820, partial [Longimicrobiaceae bacterium]